MESYRKLLNQQQTELRRLMTSGQHDDALRLFFRQHAMLHSAHMTEGEFSFEDEILAEITETQIRRIPRNCDHSVAWCIWHTARCEDVTMNLLVAGSLQILHRQGWLKRLKITARDTGNAMDAPGMAFLSDALDIEALRAYRVAVGRRTREIVQQLEPGALKRRVDPARLQQLWTEGAVVEAARGIVEYWGKRTIAGLLLMPATRHNLVHLNEALLLKRKRQ